MNTQTITKHSHYIHKCTIRLKNICISMKFKSKRKNMEEIKAHNSTSLI